jgi:hypothetical protein
MKGGAGTVTLDENAPGRSNLQYPSWQAQYEAALVETDPDKLLQRIHQAEAAIYARRSQLVSSAGEKAEQDAMEDAINALRNLKREQLNYPDRNK